MSNWVHYTTALNQGAESWGRFECFRNVVKDQRESNGTVPVNAADVAYFLIYI